MTSTNVIHDTAISKLTDPELLSFLLKNTSSSRYTVETIISILHKCNNNLHLLIHYSVEEMEGKYGILLSDGFRIKAALEFSRRCLVAEVIQKSKISCSRDVYLLFQHMTDLPYEEFWIVILNKANRVIKHQKISEGGVTGTVVDPKKVYKFALDAYACSLILVHNHPSGNILPSEADKAITTKLVNAGKLLDISVLDHIIIGCEQFYSFADNGNL